MSNTSQFSFELGTNPSSKRRSEQDPLRILFMTDLGETCQSRIKTPYASRPFRQMDIDIFEDFLETERPVIDVSGVQVPIAEMDDFHPDQIIRSVQALQDLLGLRQQLRSASTFENAALKVRSLMASDTDAGPAEQASDETDTDTMSRLFGAELGAARSAPAQTKGSVLDQMIQKAVADHIVAEADPKAEPYIAAVGAAITAHLRGVLHNPSFQSVEAAWRALEMMVSQIETDETLSIHVWNIGKSELIEAMGAAQDSPDAAVLHKRLVADRPDTPFSLIVTDVAFADGAEDLRLLATLGAIAKRTNAVVLAPMTPRALGGTSWTALLDSSGSPDVGVAALRDTGLTDNVVGLGPRYLMRQPYGKKSDPIDTFAFEEVDTSNLQMDSLLWGAPSAIAAMLIARAFSQDGWNARINQRLEFDDLPLVYYDDAGEQAMMPCAELLLPDASVEILLSTGLTPLVAVKNQNAVRLPHFQTLARPGGSDQIGPFTT